MLSLSSVIYFLTGAEIPRCLHGLYAAGQQWFLLYKHPVWFACVYSLVYGSCNEVQMIKLFVYCASLQSVLFVCCASLQSVYMVGIAQMAPLACICVYACSLLFTITCRWVHLYQHLRHQFILYQRSLILGVVFSWVSFLLAFLPLVYFFSLLNSLDFSFIV